MLCILMRPFKLAKMGWAKFSICTLYVVLGRTSCITPSIFITSSLAKTVVYLLILLISTASSSLNIGTMLLLCMMPTPLTLAPV